jgi:ribonucleoside-diphosphate reductase alpha chain
MKDEEQSPQERYAYVSEKFSSNPEHAQRLYEYASKHWLSYSTPILSFGKSKKGLPISCFLSYMQDSTEGLVDTLSETNWLSMLGGGVGVGLGIRAKDEKSTGVMPHLRVYDASCRAYQQGTTRRGSYAMYLDISHPDIEMFIDMRKATGDQNLRAPNLHHGINVTDEFMQIIEKCMTIPNYDDTWELINPHNKKVMKKISAKYLWQKILNNRMETGEPYLHFITTANRALPKWQKDKGLEIKQSNLCSEIELSTNKERTAVCCLSSVNLLYYDIWKDDPLFLSDILEMLDNVLQYFIKNAPNTIKRAKYSAMMERSVGVGALGWHSYLQKNNIAFESLEAIDANNKIFKHIREQLNNANLRLGKERGEALDAIGTGYRLSHVMSIAPNATSSIICGNVSPSIEPLKANIYNQKTLSGVHTTRNEHFTNLLKQKYPEQDIDEVWRSVLANEGSVQHLDFLSAHDKNVFKTALEIDQRWIILHASTRQRFIDQGQSINLFFEPTTNVKYLHDVHFLAWKSGCKALYYCRSENVGRTDKVGKQIERQIIHEIQEIGLEQSDECLACSG